MKLPRDINGMKLSRLLMKFGYEISRQTGSHIRLTTQMKGEHHITIPCHQTLKVGTLSSVLKEIADHLEKSKEGFMIELFRKGK